MASSQYLQSLCLVSIGVALLVPCFEGRSVFNTSNKSSQPPFWGHVMSVQQNRRIPHSKPPSPYCVQYQTCVATYTSAEMTRQRCNSSSAYLRCLNEARLKCDATSLPSTIRVIFMYLQSSCRNLCRGNQDKCMVPGVTESENNVGQKEKDKLTEKDRTETERERKMNERRAKMEMEKMQKEKARKEKEQKEREMNERRAKMEMEKMQKEKERKEKEQKEREMKEWREKMEKMQKEKERKEKDLKEREKKMKQWREKIEIEKMQKEKERQEKERKERERREKERKEKERERKRKQWREKMEIEKMQKEKERQEKERKERERRERVEKERRGKKMMAVKEKKETIEILEEKESELLENEQNKKRKNEHLKGNHTTSLENNDSDGDSENITALTPQPNSNISPVASGTTRATTTYKPETVLMTSTKHPNRAFTEEVGRSKKVLGGDTTLNTDGGNKDENHVGVADDDADEADDARVTEEAMGGVNRWDILGNNNGASLGSVFRTVCCAAAIAVLFYTVI